MDKEQIWSISLEGGGVALWLINTYIPMAGPIKVILNIVVVVVIFIWLLQVFGVIDPIITVN